MARERMSKKTIDKVARTLLCKKHVIALTGAGISQESGIATFRGIEGLWASPGGRIKELLDYNYFIEDSERWWREMFEQFGGFWTPFVNALQNAVPNQAHIALVELESRGILKYLITQNVDNLHQKAGSKAVGELHGSFLWLRCSICIRRFPLTDFFDIGQQGVVAKDFPPRCSDCNVILKCDGVLFNDALPRDVLTESISQIKQCDCMLVIGTSGIIRPAAEFPLLAKENGATLIEINSEVNSLTSICDIVIRAKAGVALQSLLARIEELKKKIIQT